jgi:PAS domain-containing protein
MRCSAWYRRPNRRFLHIYETVGLLGDQGFMLSRLDGTILVRYPDADSRIGEKIPSFSPWYAAVAQGGGRFQSRGSFIPDVRLVSVRLVSGYPLATSVGIPETAALAPWRQRSAFIAVGTLLAMICSFFLLSAIANQVRLLKASEISLAAKSSELEIAKAQTDAAVNNITQGISMFDATQRLVVCNQRYLRSYGCRPTSCRCTLQEIQSQVTRELCEGPQRNVAESGAQVRRGKRFVHTATLPDTAYRGCRQSNVGWRLGRDPRGYHRTSSRGGTDCAYGLTLRHRPAQPCRIRAEDERSAEPLSRHGSRLLS